MKRFLAVLLLCSAASAQWLMQPTWVTNPLTSQKGKVIQYGIPTGSGFWFAGQASKQYAFGCTNCVQIQTVNGVSQLYAADSHDFCKPQCVYQGTFVDLRKEIVTEGAAHWWKVSGGLSGTFTNPQGVVTENVPARYYFETFPSKDTTDVPASGGLTVVLQLN